MKQVLTFNMCSVCLDECRTTMRQQKWNLCVCKPSRFAQTQDCAHFILLLFIHRENGVIGAMQSHRWSKNHPQSWHICQKPWPVWVKWSILSTIHESVALLLGTTCSLQSLPFFTNPKCCVHLYDEFSLVVMRDLLSPETKCYDIHWHFCCLISLDCTLILSCCVNEIKACHLTLIAVIGLCLYLCIYPWSGGHCWYQKLCNTSAHHKWTILPCKHAQNRHQSTVDFIIQTIHSSITWH